MKSIDVKSLLVGVWQWQLITLISTIFLGVAATSPVDKWNENQEWEIGRLVYTTQNPSAPYVLTGTAPFRESHYLKEWPMGWEPVMHDGKAWRVRKRIK